MNNINNEHDNITIYSKFEYNEENRIKWYTDSKGRTALCFTCSYDGYCMSKLKYTKCKNYVRRETTTG